MSVAVPGVAIATAVKNRDQLERYENVSAQGEIITTDTGDAVVLANTNTKKQVVVRKVIINVYTTAAQPFAFQADGALGDIFFSKALSPAIGPHSIDYGELGYALPPGEGIEIALGVTGGNGFTYVVEAYKKPIAGAGTPAQMV